MSADTRRSPLQSALAEAGASFVERDGWSVPATVSTEAEEYRLIRSTFGVTDFSHLLKFRSEDEDAIYALDEVLAGNVANIRYGRILHTFLADEGGELLADVYVASNDEELLVFCETCAPHEQVTRLLTAGNDLLEDATDDLTAISLDGPGAWRLPADLVDPDILGMPYLSVENYELGDTPVRLLRAGKTGEFGYLLVVDAGEAEAVWRTLLDAAAPLGGGPCGLDVHDLLRLDGRFFNVHQEGRLVRDPLPIGLQWMVDFDKDVFSGRDALLARRTAGLQKKSIGLALSDADARFSPGAAVLLDGERVGEVLTSGMSYTLGRSMGLALVDRAVAYSGLDFVIEEGGAALDAASISLPPFIPESLNIKLDEV